MGSVRRYLVGGSRGCLHTSVSQVLPPGNGGRSYVVYRLVYIVSDVQGSDVQVDVQVSDVQVVMYEGSNVQLSDVHVVM